MMDMDWRAIESAPILSGCFNLAGVAESANPEMHCGEITV